MPLDKLDAWHLTREDLEALGVTGADMIGAVTCALVSANALLHNCAAAAGADESELGADVPGLVLRLREELEQARARLAKMEGN